MKRQLLLSVFLMAAAIARSQEFSVDELMSFSASPSRKFDSYISKKGFRPFDRSMQNDTIVQSWQQAQNNPDSTQAPILRKISRYQSGKQAYFSLQTSSKQEYLSAIAKLKQEGFFYGTAIANQDTVLVFQKTNYTVEASCFIEDSTLYYTLACKYQSTPSSRDITYGNDLVQFTSHELLAGFFGRSNVKSDVYYFSDKEISRCSVLFPNTTRQAVFIWKDEQNLRGLSQVIISGNFPTRVTAEFNQQMRENRWILDNGLHFNMRLDELVRLNGEDLAFYGKHSASPFMVLPQNKGNIDLANTTIVLDCINCGGSPMLDQKIVSASEALDRSLRLHVGMIILTPASAEEDKYVNK